MLTGNRKRQYSGGDEENGHLLPQAKRQSRAHPLSPEPGRDAWDSESSNSESSSSISSPEHAAGSFSSQCVVGPCSPLSSGDSSELAGPSNLVSYQQINRILREAHFQSLQSRCQLRDTVWPSVVSATSLLSPSSMSEHHMLNHFTLPYPSPVKMVSSVLYLSVNGDVSHIWRGSSFKQLKVIIILAIITVWSSTTFFVIQLFSDQSGLHTTLRARSDWLMMNPCFVLNVVWTHCYGSCRNGTKHDFRPVSVTCLVC